MAINCDSSGDEYHMTNRVFELTSGSAGRKSLVLCCSFVLSVRKKQDVGNIYYCVRDAF